MHVKWNIRHRKRLYGIASSHILGYYIPYNISVLSISSPSQSTFNQNHSMVCQFILQSYNLQDFFTQGKIYKEKRNWFYFVYTAYTWLYYRGTTGYSGWWTAISYYTLRNVYIHTHTHIYLLCTLWQLSQQTHLTKATSLSPCHKIKLRNLSIDLGYN